MTMSHTIAAAHGPTHSDVEANPQSNAGLRLLLQLLLLSSFVFSVLIVLVYFIPDGNNYPLVTLDKHARLAATGKPKVVLVGGSNLAYGIDSALIEKATGRYTVNMGMNGYLGVRFMLEEIKPGLNANDLVVLSFEYDSFYKTVDGAGKDLLMVTKTRLESLSALTLGQAYDVASTIPYAAQKKVLRVMSDVIRGAKSAAVGPAHNDGQVTPDQIVASVETREGFNDFGDLESHLEIDWPYGREDGLDLTALGIDPEVVDLLAAFSEAMKARGVNVVISYCPLLRRFYDAHRDTITDLHTRLQAAGMTIPLPPDAFVYDAPLFFDTVYHLNAKGREIRSTKLASSLKPYLPVTDD